MLISLRSVALFVSLFQALTSVGSTANFHPEKFPGVTLLYADKSYRKLFQYYLIFLDDLFVVS